MITADVDGMKRVNDTLGHASGDEVLVRLADRLKSTAPAGLAARIGGDELVVVLPGDPDAALSALRASLVGDPLPAGATVSIGWAGSTGAANVEDMWALLDHADQQMYSAKKRRQVEAPLAENVLVPVQPFSRKSPVAGPSGEGGAESGNATGRVEPTREQRLVYAAVIGWDALVGAAAALLQKYDSLAPGPNPAVLAVGLTTAAALVGAVLRPTAGRRTLTAILSLGVIVLCLIAVTSSDGETTHVGIVLWGPILLVAARYWPRSALRSLYLLLCGLHLLNLARSATVPPTVELAMIGAQLGALVAAAEILRRLRTGEERMSAQSEALALRDPLTGLANRRGVLAATLDLRKGMRRPWSLTSTSSNRSTTNMAILRVTPPSRAWPTHSRVAPLPVPSPPAWAATNSF